MTRVPGPLVLSLMAYQAFGGRIDVSAWFHWSKLFARSCRRLPSSPHCLGVVASYFIMHDTLTLAFGAAALLWIAGSIS